MDESSERATLTLDVKDKPADRPLINKFQSFFNRRKQQEDIPIVVEPQASPPADVTDSPTVNSDQDSKSQEDRGWQKRTVGKVLPLGSRIKRTEIDTKTHIEYGEKTWTTGQTIRDILQNHLDANTQKYLEQLISTVVDTDKLEYALRYEQDRERFDNFTYNLFRYAKSWRDLTPEGEQEIASHFKTDSLFGVPFKKDFQAPKGEVDMQALKEAIAEVKEVPPRILFKVTDRNSSSETEEWVDLEEMHTDRYRQKSNSAKEFSSGADSYRYQVVEVRIEDDGTGFDSKLTAFYKSTKAGKKHLRGKFGEGAKMSETHLVRNGAKIKMRSRFALEGAERRERHWQSTAYLGSDQTVKLRGVEVDAPSSEGQNFGSYTLIDIKNADQRFQKEFRDNIDPRTGQEGLESNCLDYSPLQRYYPMTTLNIWSPQPVGICLEGRPHNQYVQGLRVESTDIGHMPLLFSYDFLDSSVIKGRDRSELSNTIRSQVRNFWIRAESPVLLRALVQKAWKERNPSIFHLPEGEALNGLLTSDLNHDPPQAKRTQEILLKIMPGILGVKQGEKSVVVAEEELKSAENSVLIRTLENKGYLIIRIANKPDFGVFKKLNEYHHGAFEVYALADLRGKADLLTGEVERTDEKVRLVEPIFNSARKELTNILVAAGIEDPFSSLGANVVFLESIDPKTESPLQMDFNDEIKRFQLKLRPELILAGMKDGRGANYWKKRIQVELLATVNRKEKYPDKVTQMKHSQKIADLLIERTLHAGISDVDVLPEKFDHIPKERSSEESIRTFADRLKNIEKYILGWDTYEAARNFEASIDELRVIGDILPHIPEQYRKAAKEVLLSRVVVEGDTVGYFQTQTIDSKENLVFESKKLSELKLAGQANGRDVYFAGNKLFTLYDIPENSVIKFKDDYNEHSFVLFNGQVLDFERHGFRKYPFASFPLTFDRRCFIKRIEKYDNPESKLSSFEFELSRVEITSPERQTAKELEFLEGKVETPLPTEYGLHEWDNPVRIFEDIAQNHIDASPNGSIEAKYEVIRDGRRVWVQEEGMTPQDKIVGFMLGDNGGGYPPNNLGTMGASSKKSPMFAGKYGEGQKMIAAAAARNNFQLSFSSLGTYRDQKVRWKADVNTQDEEIIIEGKRTTAKRVIFDVQSRENNLTDESLISSTILRVPDSSNRYDDPQWQQWVDIIDPRQKDERGNGGLSRYVINMRKGDNPNVIDLGYMRILLDEPGAVYENGLLVVREEGKTAVGYDVPEVVKTRERNSYDRSKFKHYVIHATSECRDHRYADELMRQLKERYIQKLVENSEEIYVQEDDLRFRDLYDFGNLMLAKPLWDIAYATHLPGYLAYSEESLKRRMESLGKDLKSGYYHGEERTQKEKEIEQAWVTLANVSHIPKDKIISLSSENYYGWERLFPTAEEYIMSLAEEEVPVSESSKERLRAVVSASTGFISSVISDMEQSEEGKLSYESILTSNPPAQEQNYKVKEAQKNVQAQLEFWSNAQTLAANPDSVFVAPANSGYLGAAVKERLGFNERLLINPDLKSLVATGRHELTHKVFNLRDYTPEFIMMLLQQAEYNIKTKQFLATQANG